MAWTREQTQREIGSMNSGHLADTISNPNFDAAARHYAVEILVDRKAPQANLPQFAVIVQAIADERAAAAAEAARVAKEQAEAEAAAAEAKRKEDEAAAALAAAAAEPVAEVAHQ